MNHNIWCSQHFYFSTNIIFDNFEESDYGNLLIFLPNNSKKNTKITGNPFHPKLEVKNEENA